MKWTITGRGSDQKGFTLVELLAVMAIIGVLAAIVIPTVSGTRDAGQDAQAKQDISTIENAANEKFSSSQNLAQILSTESATTTAQINSVTATSTPQVISIPRVPETMQPPSLAQSPPRQTCPRWQKSPALRARTPPARAQAPRYFFDPMTLRAHHPPLAH